MNLEILTPEKKIFEGQVYGVIMPGVSGMFEVLNNHAPILSALKEGTLKVLTTKTESQNYAIKSGFVEVINNVTCVLIEGAVEV